MNIYEICIYAKRRSCMHAVRRPCIGHGTISKHKILYYRIILVRNVMTKEKNTGSLETRKGIKKKSENTRDDITKSSKYKRIKNLHWTKMVRYGRGFNLYSIHGFRHDATWHMCMYVIWRSCVNFVNSETTT